MEITQEQINKIIELAGMTEKFSNKAIEPVNITEALIEIERKIYSFAAEVKGGFLENKKILIADDLELSIYQLSTILKKIGVTPIVARHKDEAEAELQKAQFDCVIIDLFMPDSSDGLELIKLTVKRRTDYNLNTKIIVVSGTDEDSLINECYDLGVDFYIKKDKNWHTKLLKFLSTSFQTDSNVAYTKYIIDNNIVSFVIKQFNDPSIFDSVIKSINSSLYLGIKNVLFDLKDVTSFDSDNAYIFADIYKICTEKGGKFILINPSMLIKEALSFAYLEDVIIYAKSIEDAIAITSENKK